MSATWQSGDRCGPWQEGPHGRWQRCEARESDAAIVARLREQVMRALSERIPLTKQEQATARRLVAEALGEQR